MGDLSGNDRYCGFVLCQMWALIRTDRVVGHCLRDEPRSLTEWPLRFYHCDGVVSTRGISPLVIFGYSEVNCFMAKRSCRC
jgi:hypothetical protein